MTQAYIPFNRPLFLEAALGHVRKAFQNHHISGDGEFTKRCQAFFEGKFSIRKALLTTSCTDALEMCALLLDIKPGDEFILPSFTFVSTANAFALRGATPVFVDIRPDTLNINEACLEAAITPRTKAIIVVHYAGVACDMDAILAISIRHGLPIVEDNAHGLFGAYRGRPLGTIGSLATLSFHETKNLSCGEGGALLINEPRFTDRAEILREKGTDRSRFFRGEIDKYSWRDVGSSFLPSDILAAHLWAQIETFGEIQQKRRSIFHRYLEGLETWARQSGVMLPTIPEHCECSFHMFYLLFPKPMDQAAVIAHLHERGINAVFHYQPLNLTPFGLKCGIQPSRCPVAESTASRIVRLPFYFDLSLSDQERVIDAVQAYGP